MVTMIKLDIYYIVTYCLKLYELASMMTLYELGNVRMVADHYNIREVYNFTDKTTPVVFISPFPTNDMETAGGTSGKHMQCQQPIQSFTCVVLIFGTYRINFWGVYSNVAPYLG